MKKLQQKKYGLGLSLVAIGWHRPPEYTNFFTRIFLKYMFWIPILVRPPQKMFLKDFKISYLTVKNIWVKPQKG